MPNIGRCICTHLLTQHKHDYKINKMTICKIKGCKCKEWHEDERYFE